MEPKSNNLIFALCVLGVAVLHFFATFMLAFISGPTGGSTTKIATNILTFPLSIVKSGPDSPLLGWGAWVLLSLGWGLAFCTFVRIFVAAIKS